MAPDRHDEPFLVHCAGFEPHSHVITLPTRLAASLKDLHVVGDLTKTQYVYLGTQAQRSRVIFQSVVQDDGHLIAVTPRDPFLPVLSLESGERGKYGSESDPHFHPIEVRPPQSRLNH
jgi:hypothetical protein